MILAAGHGRRMFPITLTVPKPAIPVLGRPMAVQILERLAEVGADRVVINLHHLAERTRAALLDGRPEVTPEIVFSLEPELLGTAGGIRQAADSLRGAGPILLHNGDFLSDIPFAELLDHHRRSGMAATMVLIPTRPGYGSVSVDTEGRVLSLAGQPQVDPAAVAAERLFTGCHVIDESVLERIPDRMPSSIVSDVYRQLAREGGIGSYLHSGFWWEFGGPELYLEGHLHLLDLPAEVLHRTANHDPVRELDRAACAVGPGVEIAEGARFEGRSALGFACRIGRESRVRDSVILPEAWVGPGCDLQRVIVGPGCELPAGIALKEAVVCTFADWPADPPRPVRRLDGLMVMDLSPAGAG